MRMEKIRNECIRGTAQVQPFGDKVRGAKPRWFGHVERKRAGGKEDDHSDGEHGDHLLWQPKEENWVDVEVFRGLS